MKLSNNSLFVTTALVAASFAVAHSPANAAAPAAKSGLAKSLEKANAESFPELAPGSFGYQLLNGTPWIDVRYRYEHVDQNGLTEDAYASTIRTKIGYKTGVWNGFQFLAEAENIKALGADHYNSTTNGKTQFPVVADPEDTLLNQFYVSFQGLPKTDIKVGRQLITLDNHRFIGNVGWRQNDQTYDAASIASQFIDKASIYYAYVKKVNRIFGPSATSPNQGAYDGDSHIVNVSYEFAPALKVTGYDYALDFDDAPSSSSNTYGGRISGKYDVGNGVNLIYAGEFAHQSDYGSNTANYDENYYLIEPGISWEGWTAKLGYEVLEGDGTNSFQTPLATLHAFNGWADKFLTTPVNGLEDKYISLAYKVPFGDKWLKGTNIIVAYHDFQAENTSTDYGTEWDASIEQTFYDHFILGVKFAHYDADNLFTDTTKVIGTINIKY